MNEKSEVQEEGPPNFIAELVREELSCGQLKQGLNTRFPPEPNGYLHLGHAKAICVNFGIAALDESGRCNLRFDDTNPEAEDVEFVNSIKEDVRWLGFDWGDREFYASDYFDELYAFALRLIQDAKAYVDSQSIEEIREGRGNFHRVGVNSPYRERSVEENLALFEKMRSGQCAPGEHVLRAKIDMESKDLKLRDPIMYRLLEAKHHRTGDTWCMYPTYDWAHGQSDAIEGISHSLCTLEFQNHRGLYDWFLDALGFEHPPRQIEYARLNVGYTVLSKRKLRQLVDDGVVSGWDDPRMPTLAGMRRRGIPAEALRGFCDQIGVAKRDGLIDVSLLEYWQRDVLNRTATRRMAVLNPLKVVIENYPEGEFEVFDIASHPTDESMGTRSVPFGREVYIERDDFMEEPVKKWFRLAPGREVRLRGACLVTCREVIKDEAGEVVELRCTWDPESRRGASPDGRRVRGTLHWVSVHHAVQAEVRLYDRLFSVEDPLGEEDFSQAINPESLRVLRNCWVEPSLALAAEGEAIQFERLGYFCVDSVDATDQRPVFNRTIALRDSWGKRLTRKKG